MKAIGKNIVVLPVKETESKTKGGLLLAEANREDIRYRMAKVVTIGDAVVGVKDNDTIYYDRHAGFGIEIKNEKLTVIKEGDVVVVL
jgi:co-chaperonin GroES (HSP10)|tara:strand:- start:4013 stop:4273 length:261 start_codon:yes stop_codon:yes gene_type:complete